MVQPLSGQWYPPYLPSVPLSQCPLFPFSHYCIFTFSSLVHRSSFFLSLSAWILTNLCELCTFFSSWDARRTYDVECFYYLIINELLFKLVVLKILGKDFFVVIDKKNKMCKQNKIRILFIPDIKHDSAPHNLKQACCTDFRADPYQCNSTSRQKSPIKQNRRNLWTNTGM